MARGLLALGGPGSGKTQGVILPAIADRMLAGHSLIIADPQREIAGQLLAIAAVTRHLVVIHDPTSADGPRYNLAEGITGVTTPAPSPTCWSRPRRATTASGATALPRSWPPA
ncbi:MAG: type IV secretory system conjugative DNA transfer family protein [Chloroflexi bacterium]|nr:type IV secretory system conjugative DNA transfer family protein [Chloroflexota bacterium]